MLAIKIVTINIPESYVDAMEKLIGDDGLYPSRSELVRVAVREFLLKELRIAEKMTQFADNNEDEQIEENTEENDDNDDIPVEYVRIPKENGYEIYKVLKKLI
ncbi:MAG: ribbon-helix-helix domain-containing protein [Promethearchaeia archaeon]